jgi:hypothetical protein
MLLTILLLSFGLVTTTPKLVPRDEPKPPITMIDEKTLSDEDYIILKSTQAGLDPKMMLAIAKCESGLRQYDKDGKLLISNSPSKDQGLFQIWPGNAHNKEKTGYEDLKIDVTTREGNVEYAIFLMKNGGASHWSASKNCHGYK